MPAIAFSSAVSFIPGIASVTRTVCATSPVMVEYAMTPYSLSPGKVLTVARLKKINFT